MSLSHGRFVWYDLMTTDPGAAVGFYPKVAGWGTQAWDGPMPYTMWTNDGGPLVGGVMRLPPEESAAGVPPHWLPYVRVSDVDATAQKAEKLGGKIHIEGQDIPNIGRFGIIEDPQGAVIALYAPSGDDPVRDGTPRRGEFSWHELTTTDYEAAFSFYSRLFDWKKTTSFDMGPTGMYQMFGQNGAEYGGMMNTPPGMEMPPNWMCYIKVDNIDAALEAVKQQGGTVMNGPMEVPGGDMVAQCLDPQGAAFALHASKP